LGRRFVGLDIGTTAVRAAELSVRRGTVALERFGEVTLPVGAVVDGEVHDPDVVAAAVKDLWRRARFGSRQVVMGVANQRVVVRLVDLPPMEADELRRSLRFQAQEHIPIPVEDAELDFDILGEHEGGAGQRLMRVLLVAAHKDMIAAHLRAGVQAGLKPVSIDLIPFALVRSLAPEGSAPLVEAGEALIDVGSAVTNIVVHENGTPRFVRILLMGGRDITDALREGLALDYAEAERAKLAVAAGTARDHSVDQIVERRVTAFADEIHGSLDFYQAQSGAVPISRVLLTGGGSRLPSLGEHLRDALHLPVEPGRTLEAARPRRPRRDSGQLADIEPVTAVPVGLALGGVA